MYSKFARIYDKLMLDYNYGKITEFIAAQLDRYIVYDNSCSLRTEVQNAPEFSSVARFKSGIDLACGSGKFTVALSKLGHKMTGVDISTDMLDLARDNARKNCQNIIFINQDINKLDIPNENDFAVAMCDGLNYSTGGLNLFKKISKTLKSDGIFIFEMSTHLRFNTLGGNVFYYDDDDITYIWHNETDKSNKLVYMDLTFFVREDKVKYTKFTEQHIMRDYSTDEIIEAINKNDFELIEVCAEKDGTIHSFGTDTDKIKLAENKFNRLIYVTKNQKNKRFNGH